MAEERLHIRHILVALDASAGSLTALETSLELAHRLGAEVSGLFVEDINLLRAAELPFVRVVSPFSPIFQRLEFDQLERQFRAQAGQMREAMVRLAEQKGVPWSFRVSRGIVAAEVLTAGAEADLIVMGRVGRSFTRGRQIGSTVRTVVYQRRGLTFILHTERWTAAAPVAVMYDGSLLAKKAMEAAIYLGQIKNSRMIVFVQARDKHTARALREEATEKLRAFGLEADYRLLAHTTPSMIAQLVQSETGGPVVLPCERGQMEEEELCKLLSEMPNPILLVR